MKKFWKPALAGLTAAVLAAAMLPMGAFAAEEPAQKAAATPYYENLLVNPGFEEGKTGWQYIEDENLVTDNVYSGQSALRGAKTYVGFGTVASQKVTGLQKGTYELSAYVDSRGSQDFFYFGGALAVNGKSTSNLGNTQGWKLVTLPFTVDADGTDVTVELKLASGLIDGETICYYDDVRLERIKEIPPVSPDSNFIQNSGFEAQLQNWNQNGAPAVAATNTIQHTQSNSLMMNQLAYGPMTDYLSQDIAVNSTGTYQLSGWFRTMSPMEGIGGAMLIIEVKDAVGTVIASKATQAVLDTGNAWKQVSASLEVPAQAKTITVKLGVSAATGTFYADDIQLTVG